jgi:hypothetical protein
MPTHDGSQDEFSQMLDGFDDPMDAGRTRRGGRARVLTLFGKRRFDYTFLFEGTNRNVVIRRALRVVPFYHYSLMVRVHAVDIQAGTFNLACFNTLPSAQDPQEFSSATNNGLSINIDSSTAAGSLLIDPASAQGPFFKVVLNAAQGFGTTPIRFYAELSAVLYGRAPIG